MAKPLRIEFRGAIYHVMGRGNARQKIFRDDRGYQRLLDGLEAVLGKFAWQVMLSDALGLGHPDSAGNLVRRLERERRRSVSLRRDLN